MRLGECVFSKMHRPAPDFFHDYLEGMDLLAALREKEAHIRINSESIGGDGHDVEAILEGLSAKIGRVEVWIRHSENKLEEGLHASANRADAGRELLLSVSRAVRELKLLTPEEWAALSEGQRNEWVALLGDYETLRNAWLAKLPPEEGAAFTE